MKFKGRRSDLKWGTYDYSVTRTQKDTLDGLEFIMSSQPRVHSINKSIPQDYFCVQQPDTGSIVIGIYGRSVTINRYGRITTNAIKKVKTIW